MTLQTKWEEEFDEKFPAFKNRAFTEDTKKVLKQFIRSLLSQQAEEKNRTTSSLHLAC